MKKNKKTRVLANKLTLMVVALVFVASVGTYFISKSKASVLAPSDINSDNKVDIFDLSILLSNWGKTGVSTSDINGDSTINIFDLSLLLSKWGPVSTSSPFSLKVEAENFTSQSGVQTNTTPDTGGGLYVGWTQPDDWVQYTNLNFTSAVNTVEARLATSVTGSSIEVRLDSPTGALLGTINAPNTGSWNVYQTVSASLNTQLTGNHTIAFVFRNSSVTDMLLDINWFNLTNGVVSTPVPTVTPIPTTTPTPSGTMPTRDNTGPRYTLTDMTPEQFYASRTCNRQRITGPVLIEQIYMRGQTFNITDCEITGNMAFYLIGGNQQLPEADMPTMNIAYTDILGGVTSQHAVKLNVDHSYIFGRVQMKLTDGWPITTPGYAPYVFSNSLLYNEYLSQPTHTETLQTAGYGTGTSFTNVVFLQQGGPLANTGVTAVVNYVGDGTVFDGCYFLWDGEIPAWYTVYISGPGVIVRNSWFDAAAGGYVYPNSPEIMPTFANNRNYRNNAPLNLP